MRHIVWWIVAGFLATVAISGQNFPDRITLVELRGEVARVRIVPGEGMPCLEITSGNQLRKVYLGSVRYLMVQGFNPKIGEPVMAKVYKMNHGFVAVTVTLPAQNKTLRLRDDRGRPVWRHGHGR